MQIQDYLAIMSTSVPCEQLFSLAGLTVTKSRGPLKPCIHVTFYMYISQSES